MTVSIGDKLPDATFLRLTDQGPEEIKLSDKTAGRKVVIIAVPAAFSALCDQAHVPSFIRTKGQFEERGVDEIICLAVNDPFVMQAWGKTTGATEAGITMLSDSDGAFAKSIGMAFDAPVVGLFGRSVRYAMVVDDGVVTAFNTETQHGVCETTAGEGLLEVM